jgi:U3 small nucleolar RNA-associated protein 11
MMSRKGPGSRIQNGKSWSGTVEGDRGNKSYDVETVRLLKTQDLGYIRTMRQVTAKELAKLEEQIVLTRGFDHLDDDDDEEDGDDFDEDDSDDDRLAMPVKPKPTRKIVFMDDEDEREAAMDEQEQRDTEQNDDEEGKDDDQMEGEELERAKSLRRVQRQLDQAKRRLKALTAAESELDIQRAKMAKTATSGGETRRGKKIMVRKRKR